MAGGTFVYVTSIRATVEEVCSAFIKLEYVKKFWFDIDVETDWQVGSPWCIKYPDGRTTDSADILALDPHAGLPFSGSTSGCRK